MFAIVDIETTGGSLAQGSRITEVAVVIHDGEKIIQRYSTLVNPQSYIPAFITNLTGITNEMVENAPVFSEVASDLLSLFENRIFVAHNVSFDYGHLLNEFKRCGISYKSEKICTCTMSRKIFPGFGSYSLGKLSKNLGIEMEKHHRALSDANAAAEILDLLIRKAGIEAIRNYSMPEKKEYPLPHHLLENLPETHGVYFFQDKNGKVIYIGKANNILKRVTQHLQKRSYKSQKFKSLIESISYTETGNELLACMIELEEIKRQLPFFNRAGKTEKQFGIFDALDKNGFYSFYIDELKDDALPLKSFKSKKTAEEFLYENTKHFHLCASINQLERTKGACFLSQTKICYGACSGNESTDEYNTRALQLFKSLETTLPEVILLDKGKNYYEKSAVVFHDKKLGYCYFNVDEQLTNEELFSRLHYFPVSEEMLNLFNSFLKRKKYKKLISLAPIELFSPLT